MGIKKKQDFFKRVRSQNQFRPNILIGQIKRRHQQIDLFGALDSSMLSKVSMQMMQDHLIGDTKLTEKIAIQEDQLHSGNDS